MFTQKHILTCTRLIQECKWLGKEIVYLRDKNIKDGGPVYMNRAVPTKQMYSDNINTLVKLLKYIMRSLAFFNFKYWHHTFLELKQRDKGNKVYGQDVTLDDIKKLSKHYKNFDFCGQLSDCTHPKFIEILEYLKSVNCGAMYITLHHKNLCRGISRHLKQI